MFIRGLNTLNCNAQPLIVVDGTIWDFNTQTSSLFDGFTENALADIDVNDIENVQILKDATAIYGANGANGAILVTTKRSHSVVTKITADVSYGFNFAPKTYDTMNSPQFRTYLSEAMKNSSQAGSLATTYNTWLNSNASSQDYSTYHNETNWNDEVRRTGNTQHYGVSVEGSDDVADYAITVGYTGSNTTVKEVDFSRLNARINANVNVLKNFNIATQMMFSYLTRNLQDDGTQANTSPTFLASIKSPFLAPYSYTNDGSQLTNTLNDVDVIGVSNPNSLIENAKNTYTHYRFGLSLAPQWTINDKFSLNGRFSYQFTNTKEHYFTPITGVSAVVVDGNVWENTVKDQSYNYNSIYADGNFSYKDNFGLSAVSANIGMRMLHTALKYSYAEGHNTGNDVVSNLNNSLSYRDVDGSDTSWGNSAITLQAKYSYDQRYTLNATLVTEASSRFGKNAKASYRMMGGSWATFPSVSAEWNIGKEQFMRNVPAVNDLRLHVGYGAAGNDDINALNRYSYLNSVSYLGKATGLQIGSLANENLKWEVTRKFNIGLSTAFLNERITLGFDYFVHNTSDLLNYRTPDVTTGQTTYLYNAGKLRNKGYEISIGARPVALKDFSWMTNLSFMHYKNEITELPAGSYTTGILGGQVLTAVGNSAGVFYGYKTNGVYSTQAEAEADALKVQNSDASYSHFSAGDIRFVDTDDNGIIDDNDRQVIGNPNPDLTGSFYNRFTYRRFTLDVLCTFSLGGDIYNYQRQLLESMSGTWNQTTAVLNRWKSEGQMTSMPKAVYGDPMGNSRFSDRWIENGSFFKVKSAKLSYNMPIENNYIHGITLWVAADNIVTFTKYLGIDPEVSMNSSVLYQGVDNGMLANGRAFTLGAKINL